MSSNLHGDLIRLTGIEVQCIIGILPEERRTPQPVYCDVEMELDLEPAAVTGELSRTVDYARTAAEIRQVLEEGRFRLLESAARAIAQAILDGPPGAAPVARATVRLAKPKALPQGGLPSVQITRSRAVLTAKTPDATLERLADGSLRVCAISRES